MTLITCNIFQSGTATPLDGYINVTSNNYLTDSTKFYTATPQKYPLVAGFVEIDLIPTDLAKVAYRFDIYSNGDIVAGIPDTLLNSFDAIVPFSATAINLNTLAPQSGIRYDARDASILTLARYLSGNDPFINFLGGKLWAHRGNWVTTTVYKRGEVVFRNGSSYQYTSNEQLSGSDPLVDTARWGLLVKGIAVGVMVMFPTGATLPPGFIRCDGSVVSRTTYATLFAVIGTTQGVGNGSTTFNLPDSPITGSASFIIYTGL